MALISSLCDSSVAAQVLIQTGANSPQVSPAVLSGEESDEYKNVGTVKKAVRMA